VDTYATLLSIDRHSCVPNLMEIW